MKYTDNLMRRMELQKQVGTHRLAEAISTEIRMARFVTAMHRYASHARATAFIHVDGRIV